MWGQDSSDEEIVKRIEYFKNGNISLEHNYKDGKKDGKWTVYYKYGQMIWGEGNYKDGELDGKWTYYYENGRKEWEEDYKDGKSIK